MSPRLGDTVRTNSEAIVGSVAHNVSTDYSEGVAITSSIHPGRGRSTPLEPEVRAGTPPNPGLLHPDGA